MNVKKIFSLLVLKLVFIANAWADNTLVIEVSNPNPNSTNQSTETTTMLFKNNKIRIDNSSQSIEQDNSSMIFDNQKAEMLILHPQQKSYIVINKASMAGIKQQMDVARQQMKKEMANMPEEQKAMMMQMMGDKMAALMDDKPKKNNFDIKTTDRADKAASYSCKISEVYKEGKKVTEACLVPWSTLKNGKQMSNSFKGMIALFQEMASYLPMMNDSKMAFSKMLSIEGFPVIVTEYENGQATEVSKLISINDDFIDDKSFSIPEDYQQQSLMQPH